MYSHSNPDICCGTGTIGLYLAKVCLLAGDHENLFNCLFLDPFNRSCWCRNGGAGC